MLGYDICAQVVASTTKIQKWKQITTPRPGNLLALPLLPVRQRYKNESKSQPGWSGGKAGAGCCQYDKDTKMKANHNFGSPGICGHRVVASTTKIQKWKQITTSVNKGAKRLRLLPVRQRYKNESKSQPIFAVSIKTKSCCQYDKDTKMKANHNILVLVLKRHLLLPVRQRYKNESKSQQSIFPPSVQRVVASTTKIQKWKQITTCGELLPIMCKLLPVRQRYKNESKSQHRNAARYNIVGCCQYDKDTKMKANHNILHLGETLVIVVASTTKIQKWKQITTFGACENLLSELLPVRQRYKNESKSQHTPRCFPKWFCCCQYDKDTKMKANHN